MWNKLLAAFIYFFMGTFIMWLVVFPRVSYIYSISAPRMVYISNFDQCVQAGYPVMQSYPRRCSMLGKIFIEDIKDKPTADTDVFSPRPNQLVTSPLQISGVARGSWFFEASFPVELIADDGKIIEKGVATTKGNWMTSKFVAFSASLKFSKPASQKGTLILKKANPSGLPENADQISIPINFK